MIILRSLAFHLAFYANLVGQMLFFLPVFFVVPERVCWRIVSNWARSSLWILRVVAGTRTEIGGQENIPAGGAIIASKHQSFWETFALIPELTRPAFILKKELMAIPIFGWYAKRMRMIPVDRSKRGAVLPSLLGSVHAAVEQGRHIVIFPEGTRVAPGAAPNYRPGVHYLYSQLDLTIVPVAVNSGLFWPRKAFKREPGTIRARFMPAIGPGLPREPFIAQLREEIEAGSNDLMRQAYAERPDLPMSELVRDRLAEG
ncbi:lysophospholipid acyltransferase family protein [Aureimonas mangrovi]|uniref:lysophospholipid acyltransferase family protein n=1 Tax=Aureimonas mangrovi TaxID=2758041 RepID=UPI00163D60FD|nr:lysophospholipid acyltransferase family protein [Aureimonas mangrovi]